MTNAARTPTSRAGTSRVILFYAVTHFSFYPKGQSPSCQADGGANSSLADRYGRSAYPGQCVTGGVSTDRRVLGWAIGWRRRCRRFGLVSRHVPIYFARTRIRGCRLDTHRAILRCEGPWKGRSRCGANDIDDRYHLDHPWDNGLYPVAALFAYARCRTGGL